MSTAVVDDLIWQFQHALAILNEEVERFSDEQWVTGFEFFQVPARQAIHLLECLDFYFAPDLSVRYQWGARFGGGWWELKEDELPNKAMIIELAREIETKIMTTLAGLTDDDLLKPLPHKQDWGATFLGHYTYALRHTAHHQGQLGSLASYHGHQGGSWEW
jgi:hypothetical protein